MEKSNNNQSSAPASTADLSALKTEIIAAVKDTVQGLATQETVSAVMETAAETKDRLRADVERDAGNHAFHVALLVQPRDAGVT